MICSHLTNWELTVLDWEHCTWSGGISSVCGEYVMWCMWQTYLVVQWRQASAEVPSIYVCGQLISTTWGGVSGGMKVMVVSN